MTKTFSSRRILIGGLLLGCLLQVAAASAQIVKVVSTSETTRTVSHAIGSTEIPARPSRIVTLHNIFAEALVAFGTVPIGSVDHPAGLPSQLAGALKDIPSVGQQTAPDFEAILALEPDLILAQADQHGQNYALLSAIAPTVLLDEPNDEWREWFVALGDALGRPQEAQAAVLAYDRRAAEVKRLVASIRPDETVMLLRVREKDIRIYGAGRRSGPVLYKDLGLVPHPLVPMHENYVAISNEIIPRLTADHLFLMVEDESKMAGIQETALWRALPAVKAGRVHRVGIEPWNQSAGPISFGVIVEDVAAALGRAR